MVITDYEEKIESLCQHYEFDKEILESNHKSNNKKKQKTILLFLSVIFTIGYIIYSGTPVIVSFLLNFLKKYLNNNDFNKY